ncbi:unnamed protein product [Cyprideis torosa]|uniref:3-phosphoinositide-dependent protein kinase 1 n=1 Tax=Cyprideis torosa TaxID=163714 RepID=A0A7R8WDE2_9CRUS|nr:unnamed protein product [Cyprideis torosa]CAG0888289.1 unnamed protein product [Cyprideis torosa]
MPYQSNGISLSPLSLDDVDDPEVMPRNQGGSYWEGGDRRTRSVEDYIFLRELGNGSYSTVYLAREKCTGRKYAIKVCDKSRMIREKKTEYAQRERDVMILLDRKRRKSAPFFVQLACTFKDHDSLYFVMSFECNGDILSHLRKVGTFDEECCRFYGGEIIHGLEHMHRLGILHRDLKPENILLSETFHIRISDYGVSKFVKPKNGKRRSSFVGTAQYVSPEVLESKKQTFACDLWSYACILYQMVAGVPPFRGDHEYAIFQKIMHLDYSFPEGFHPLAKDLIEKLLVKDVLQRLQFLGVALEEEGEETSIGSAPNEKGNDSASSSHPSEQSAGRESTTSQPPVNQSTDGVSSASPNSTVQVTSETTSTDQSPAKTSASSNPAPSEAADGSNPSTPSWATYPKLTNPDYWKIKTHSFFSSLDFETLYLQTPPEIRPHLLPPVQSTAPLPPKKKNSSSSLRGEASTSGSSQPSTSSGPTPRSTSSLVTLGQKNKLMKFTEEERQKRLVLQEKKNTYHRFTDGNLIIYQGFLDKRKGLIPRKRMFLLTTGPHLYYIDPYKMVKKGEVPWSPELRPEAKNFKTFFIHTPKRTYYLEDSEGRAPEWCDAVSEVYDFYFSPKATATPATTEKHHGWKKWK